MLDTREYIDLNRQFVELGTEDIEAYDIEARIQWGMTSAYKWPDLLNENRVVILSSAGTGKTWEIYRQCEKLRAKGKKAFFIRLEYLASEWEGAFEIGNAEELKTTWPDSVKLDTLKL